MNNFPKSKTPRATFPLNREALAERNIKERQRRRQILRRLRETEIMTESRRWNRVLTLAVMIVLVWSLMLAIAGIIFKIWS